MTFKERLFFLLSLYSKNEMARKTGVSPRTVEGWCQGRPVSLPVSKIVKEMYDVEAEKLAKGRGDTK
jgi:hypothetical protein